MPRPAGRRRPRRRRGAPAHVGSGQPGPHVRPGAAGKAKPATAGLALWATRRRLSLERFARPDEPVEELRQGRRQSYDGDVVVGAGTIEWDAGVAVPRFCSQRRRTLGDALAVFRSSSGLVIVLLRSRDARRVNAALDGVTGESCPCSAGVHLSLDHVNDESRGRDAERRRRPQTKVDSLSAPLRRSEAREAAAGFTDGVSHAFETFKAKRVVAERPVGRHRRSESVAAPLRLPPRPGSPRTRSALGDVMPTSRADCGATSGRSRRSARGRRGGRSRRSALVIASTPSPRCAMSSRRSTSRFGSPLSPAARTGAAREGTNPRARRRARHRRPPYDAPTGAATQCSPG